VGTEKTVTPDFNTIDLQKGDCILLCTDGLSALVDVTAILKEITENPAAAPENLIRIANENGGSDNITVVVAINDE
jgi:protein phosphatase